MPPRYPKYPFEGLKPPCWLSTRQEEERVMSEGQAFAAIMHLVPMCGGAPDFSNVDIQMLVQKVSTAMRMRSVRTAVGFEDLSVTVSFLQSPRMQQALEKALARSFASLYFMQQRHAGGPELQEHCIEAAARLHNTVMVMEPLTRGSDELARCLGNCILAAHGMLPLIASGSRMYKEAMKRDLEASKGVDFIDFIEVRSMVEFIQQAQQDGPACWTCGRLDNQRGRGGGDCRMAWFCDKCAADNAVTAAHGSWCIRMRGVM